MSASKHKKERQELYASGKIDRDPELTAKKQAAKKTVIVSIIALLVAFFVIVILILTSTTFLQTQTTAVKVGSHRISPAMFNFYYWTEYYDICESYGDNLANYINTEAPLTEQYQDAAKGITWSEYIKGKAIATIQEVYSVYDSAKDAGYTLSEEEQAEYDTLSSTIDSAASAAGFEDDVDGFVASMYGEGCTKDLYLEYEEISRLAKSYAQDYMNSIEITDEEAESYYTEHREDFDTITYRIYNCLVKKDDPSLTGSAAVDQEASEALAQTMAELSFQNEEKYIELAESNSSENVKEIYEDPSATLRENVTFSSIISDDLRAWLSDESRVSGDTTYLQNSTDNSYNVIYFVERNTKDYSMVNIRDVFFAFEEDPESALYGYYADEEDIVYTEESQESAKTLSEKAMNNFLLTDCSEDAFIEIVKTYSEDPNAETTYGLYENYEKGTLSPEVDAWAYDANRKVGDYITVASHEGYYMLYFSGFGENYRIYSVSNTLRQQRYEEWYTSSSSALTATEKWGMRYAKL